MNWEDDDFPEVFISEKYFWYTIFNEFKTIWITYLLFE